MTHTVFFWLKKDLSAEQRELFEQELRLLPQIGYLADGKVGRPAATAARPVIDHSYDYSLILEFQSMADHDFYQDECPEHKRFVETCKPMFERVTVYDSEPLG